MPPAHDRPDRAVLFDLDATLFDHIASCRAGLRALQRGFDCMRCWGIDDLEAHYSRLLEEIHIRVLRREVTPAQARRLRMSGLLAAAGERGVDPDAMAACYQEAYLAARAPVAGAAPLLTALRSKARIGIVTNNTLAEQRRKLDDCGLTPLVDTLVVSDDVGCAKPDPRIFALALDQLGVPPQRAVMVGDSWEMDVLGARAAGIRAIWFNPGARPRPAPGPAPGPTGGPNWDHQALASFLPVDAAVELILHRLDDPAA